MADRFLPLPNRPYNGRGFGRNIRHDQRSFAYRIGRTAAPTTKVWTRNIPILDQGELGSCTGNATVGALGTGPNYDALSTEQRSGLNEALAVQIYSDATTLDDAPGSYPPDDTGSDGLSVAKVASNDGYISGYQHIMSLGEAYAAILDGPFIVGSIFTSRMESPDKNGVVVPTGQVLGGHEWLMRGYDEPTDLWLADNSWSEDWGIDGSFKMSSKTLTYLLAQQGDATPFVPLSQPAPTPDPTPDPTPAPASTQPDWDLVDPFLMHPRAWKKAQVAAAELTRWKGSLPS